MTERSDVPALICFAPPRRGTGVEARMGPRVVCSDIIESFHCRIYTVTEMGNSAARIPRQNLLVFCSELDVAMVLARLPLGSLG
jgi:hypothetical protein